MVLDLDLGAVGREAVGEGGDEGGALAAAADGLDHVSAIGAQHAPLVRHSDVGHLAADKIDQLRAIPATEGILSFSPVAADVVEPLVHLGHQLWNLLGRVLQVGVEGDDDLAADAFEGGHDGHVLAVVSIEVDDADLLGVRPVKTIR